MNKRVSNSFFAGLVALLLVASTPLVYAAAVNYSGGENGTVTGQAKVNKVGTLLFGDAVAALTASEVTVTSNVHGKGPEHNTEQLHGKVGKVTVSGHTARGYALFKDGPGIDNLKPSTDLNPRVVLKDGTVLKGDVTDMDHDTLTIHGEHVPLSQVSSIHSPYVYEFRVPITGNSPSITFDSTTQPGSGGLHAHAAHGGAHTIVILGVVGAVVATAIAVPVAVPLAVAANDRNNHHSTSAPLPPLPIPFKAPTTTTTTPSSGGHGTSDIRNTLSHKSTLARWQALGQRIMASPQVRSEVRLINRLASSPQVATVSRPLVRITPVLIKSARVR